MGSREKVPSREREDFSHLWPTPLKIVILVRLFLLKVHSCNHFLAAFFSLSFIHLNNNHPPFLHNTCDKILLNIAVAVSRHCALFPFVSSILNSAQRNSFHHKPTINYKRNFAKSNFVISTFSSIVSRMRSHDVRKRYCLIDSMPMRMSATFRLERRFMTFLAEFGRILRFDKFYRLNKYRFILK